MVCFFVLLSQIIIGNYFLVPSLLENGEGMASKRDGLRGQLEQGLTVALAVTYLNASS